MNKTFSLLIYIMCLACNLLAQAELTIIKLKENYAVINKGVNDGVKSGDQFTLFTPSSPKQYGIVEVIRPMNSISAIKLLSGYSGYRLKVGDKELKKKNKIIQLETSIENEFEKSYDDKPQVETKSSKTNEVVAFSWNTSRYSQTPHAVGANAEIGGASVNNSFGSGYEVRVSIGLFYSLQKTFIIEGNIGANSWNAPAQLYDPINNAYYDQDSERIRKIMYALGAYFTPISIRAKNNKLILPFIGIRSVWYTGFGETGDALDSLYSSDTWESYESNNNFHFSFGFLWAMVLFRTDIRLTNNVGNFSAGAYDPFGVGRSYYYEVNGVDETKVMFHIGVCGLFANL